MRKIINLLLTGLVLWLGNKYFNDYIRIDSERNLIIATLLMFGIDILYGWLVGVFTLTSVIAIGCLPLILSIIVAPFLTFIKLYYIDKYLPGFDLNGFWTYVILFVALSAIHLEVKVTTSNIENK